MDAEGACIAGMHPQRPSHSLLRLQSHAGAPCIAPHAPTQRCSLLFQRLCASRGTRRPLPLFKGKCSAYQQSLGL